jgi:ATP-dependent Clp protease adapter protein ClpS
MNTSDLNVISAQAIEALTPESIPALVPEHFAFPKTNMQITLHNDPSSMPAFVQRVLREAFKIEKVGAKSLMTQAHSKGESVVGTYIKAQADEYMATAAAMITEAKSSKDFAGKTHGFSDKCELRFSVKEI